MEAVVRPISHTPPRDEVARRTGRVVAMVHELHKAGYQRLRISPGMSPSGMHWRCSITCASNIAPDGFSIARWDECLVAPYSSATVDSFGWDDADQLSARAMASRFLVQFPRLAELGAGRDWAYAGWLTECLGAVEQGDTLNYPVFYADYPIDISAQLVPPPPPPVAERGASVGSAELRRCLREPIDDIFEAAELLNRAIDAHLGGDRKSAADLIRSADLPAVRAWTDSLWGKQSGRTGGHDYIRYHAVAGSPPMMAKADRKPARMPSAVEKRALVVRYGHVCAFCRIPLIRAEVRRAVCAAYPTEAAWGGTVATQHAAFSCLWLQYDHLLPHSRGGETSLDNLIITCAGCNYGRMHYTLAEVGLLDPSRSPSPPTEWTGLERMLSVTT